MALYIGSTKCGIAFTAPAVKAVQDSWVRPSGMPDTTAINIAAGTQALYLTYDTSLVPSSCCFAGFVCTLDDTSATFKVERGTVSGTTFTVAATSNIASGTVFREIIPTGNRYVVYRITPTDSTKKITTFQFRESDAIHGTITQQWKDQACVELYGRLENITTFASTTTASWTTANMKSFKLVGTYKPASCAYMFYIGKGLLNIEIENLDMSSCTNTSYMFQYCTNIQNLDKLNLNSWDVSKVTTMACMFASCYRLEQLNISNWNPESTTSLTQMFDACYSLTSVGGKLDWNVGRVTDMSYMFRNCYALTNLDLSSWTGVSTTYAYMFLNCYALKQLDLSNLNFSLVTTATGSFANCRNLTEIKLPANVTASKLTEPRHMFLGCSAIRKIDLTGWSFPACANFTSMFSTMPSLEEAIVPDLVTSKATTLTSMFWADSSLKKLVTSNWNTANVINISTFLSASSYMQELDISNWNLTKVTAVASMKDSFNRMTSLNKVTLPATLKIVGTTCFANSTRIHEYHFKGTTPPTLAAATAMPVASGVKIYVPSGSLDAYASASIWSASFVNYLVGE